jgi:hypothetical protein
MYEAAVRCSLPFWDMNIVEQAISASFRELRKIDTLAEASFE